MSNVRCSVVHHLWFIFYLILGLKLDWIILPKYDNVYEPPHFDEILIVCLCLCCRLAPKVVVLYCLTLLLTALFIIDLLLILMVSIFWSFYHAWLMTTMSVVGECFFWYRLTRVVPDKFHRAVKRLCVCVLPCNAMLMWYMLLSCVCFCLCVCLSVCLPHTDIVSKWLNLRSHNKCHMIALGL